MTNRILIIVDMLNDFIDEKGALYCGPQSRSIIAPISERLQIFRQRGDLTIFMQDAHEKNDVEFERFPEHCVSGTWGSRVIDQLAPLPNEIVIPKKTLSPFYGTTLDLVLADSKAKDVDVVGVCTSICVMDAVGGLSYRGYRIQVPEKEVADFDPDMHRFALTRMDKIYGAKIL